MVPVDGGSRKVALSAIESPENWFEDRGGAQLVNGAAVVQLEPIFAQTINTEVDYRVFLKEPDAMQERTILATDAMAELEA